VVSLAVGQGRADPRAQTIARGCQCRPTHRQGAGDRRPHRTSCTIAAATRAPLLSAERRGLGTALSERHALPAPVAAGHNHPVLGQPMQVTADRRDRCPRRSVLLAHGRSRRRAAFAASARSVGRRRPRPTDDPGPPAPAPAGGVPGASPAPARRRGPGRSRSWPACEPDTPKHDRQAANAEPAKRRIRLTAARRAATTVLIAAGQAAGTLQPRPHRPRPRTAHARSKVRDLGRGARGSRASHAGSMQASSRHWSGR
jgi:hypothetical protein